MPTVVRIAATAQAIMIPETTASKLLRARKRGPSRDTVMKVMRIARERTTTRSAASAMPCQELYVAAAAAISGVGVPNIAPAATLRMLVMTSAISLGLNPSVIDGGSVPRRRLTMTVFWKATQRSSRSRHGMPTQMATNAP